MMKNIFLLGATGSIGTQVLDVVRNNHNKYKIISISVGKNVNLAKKIIEEFQVEYVSIIEKKDAETLKKLFPNVIIEYGEKSIINAATYSSKKGVLINAVVGYSGLIPTIEAIKCHRDILLANKETLVCAGKIIKNLIKEYNVSLIPIDSEHSAIFQAMQCGKKEEVKRLIITASGGSFRDKTREELNNVTLKDALKHPSWSMGDKITIDSATMVNKGLEVIEAHYLFDIDYDNITTIIHKESVVHSIVEFVDNSMIAQMAVSDMRIPIQYALTYPNREKFFENNGLDLIKYSPLNFEKMDFNRFPMLALAYKVGKMGGVMPAVFNISNEVANELFRKGLISFLDIEHIITRSVTDFDNINNPSIEDILKVTESVKNKILEKYEV